MNLRERLGVELDHALAHIDFHHVVAEFAEAVADFLGIGKLVDSGFPGVRDEGFVDDGGVGVVDRKELQSDFGGELIAFVIFVGVRGAGGEGLALVFFLISVAAEVVFLFEKQKIFAAQEIGGGEAGDAAADDDDVGFARGVGAIERVAVANLVADFEVFAVNDRSRAPAGGCGAATSVESMGQPAATDPTTTNLMKSRRELDMGPPRVVREDLAVRRRGRACARDTR